MNGQLVDEFEHLTPNTGHMFRFGKLAPDFLKLKFYITRESSPRFMGLKIEFKHRLQQNFSSPHQETGSGRKIDGDREAKLELVDYPSLPAIECGRPAPKSTAQ